MHFKTRLATSVVGSMVAMSAIIATYGQMMEPKANEPPEPIPVPVCQADDGSGSDPCYWNARTMGNGQGTPYIIVKGVQYDYTPPKPGYPKTLVINGQPYIVY